MTNTNIYYVYAYIRHKDSKTAKAGTPYYIGKGSGKRAFETHKKGGYCIRPKDYKNIIIMESNLTELGAFALERRMIRWYGRKDANTGILCNRTDGGEGYTGIKPNLVGDKNPAKRQEVKDKISKANTGMKLTEEQRLKNSLAHRGLIKSKETREKLRNAQLGKPKIKCSCIYCRKVTQYTNILRWHSNCEQQTHSHSF
jgi:hypothetical protein